MTLIRTESLTVTATTSLTSNRSNPINTKNVQVEASWSNTDTVYVAVFDEFEGTPSYFDTLQKGEKRFYRASSGKKIRYVFGYTNQGTQKLKLLQSDGSFNTIEAHDNAVMLQRENWLADGTYVERLEQGFGKELYHGRTGAYYKSDSTNLVTYRDWSVPPLLSAVNTVQVAPWNNAFDMRNANPKAPTTLDEIYVGLPKAHFRTAMRFDAMMPTLAHLGLNDNIVIGYETNSAGGICIAALIGNNGAYTLYTKLLDINTGQVIYDYKVVTLGHTAVFCTYYLVWNFPLLSLIQDFGGTQTLLGQVMCNGNTRPQKMIPFFANESATNLITDFQLGQFQAFELEQEPIAYSTGALVNPAGNPTLIGNVAGRANVEIYVQGVTAGTAVYVQASQDGTNWRDLSDQQGLTYNVSQPSGLVSLHVGFLNAYRFVKVLCTEHVAGTYLIEINTSEN